MVCKASCAHGAPPTSPPTGLSCLKRHRDPWCFTRCCGSSSLVFLPKDTERHTPHPAAAILHISQATFCMLPKHRPDPTVTEYSLGILSAANQRAQQGSAQLPQSPAGHRGDAGLVPSMAPGRALQARSHCSWCLLIHSSFPVCSLFPGTPGPVQTGMSTQADVARGRVCVVHGNVQTALVSRTKSSPQRRCEDSTSGNTCASLHSCLNPVTQPLSVLGLNTLPTSTCLSSLSLSASGLNNQSGLQAEVHTQENWNGFQPCLHIAWLRCEMRLHSQGRNLGHSQGWSDLLQYPWELLLLSISDSRAMPRQMYYHNIATVLAKPASPG